MGRRQGKVSARCAESCEMAVEEALVTVAGLLENRLNYHAIRAT